MATIWARRRLIRDGAELRNEPNCRILPIPQGLGGSHRFTNGSPQGENVLAAGRCRDRGENSNVSVVRWSIGSRFIVAGAPATVEIFSAKLTHAPRFTFSNSEFVIASVNEDVSRTRCSVSCRCTAEPGPIGANLIIDPGSEAHHAAIAARCAASEARRYTSAFPRHDAPELCLNLSPNKRERGMPGARCTRSRACRVVSTRVSHHGRTGITRHSRTRWC